ncbi:GNAT family N-acetyltransferase [Polycladomyces subterraneus]|uniref:GNAT family N-acetyltransferase n=1 Tax=Polycladomyces subterraneus TaxID=1016997 RepID=A0ABT8IJU5_9BACL|nr:GNAT family protein [Polycladomyces subterraneus]MDN4593032.1 GNAT family N-acetyltransferase [Polycladomyces subterraneus]
MEPNRQKRIVIREAERKDSAAILSCLQQVTMESDFLSSEPDEMSLTVEQEEQFIEEMSARSNSLFLVAQSGEEIVGTLTFTGGTTRRTRHVGEAGAAVLRDYWGNGIGSKLIQGLLDWCPRAGIRKVNGRTRSDNVRAIRLCEKMGFQREGVSKRAIQIDGWYFDFVLLGRVVE